MADLNLLLRILGDSESLRQAVDKSKNYLSELKDKTIEALGNPLVAAPLVASVRLAQTSYQALSATGTGAMRAISEAGTRAVGTFHDLNRDISELRGNFVKFTVAVGTAGVTAWRGVSFEESFANVKKVVSGTDEELKALAQQIKQLSTELSVPLEQLAQIAVFGGQMGLPADEIAAFTQLVAKMAVAFEMVPEEAAKSLGNLRNIFKLSLTELETFGDQINMLADSANTTEQAMLNVLSRSGGVAQQFGLLRGETAALAAGFLNLGRAPEVAGTTMQNMLMSLQNAPSQTKDFQAALQAIGLDANQLANDIQTKPNVALDDFLARIERLTARSRGQVLSGLFGKGEDTAAIGDLIDSLGEYHRLVGLTSKDEIFTGSMAATFAQREATVSAAVQRLKNTFNVFAISASELFLPTIRFAIDALRDLVAAITQLSEHSPNLAGFLRIAAVIAPLGGLFRLTSLAITTLMPGIAAAFSSAMAIITSAAGGGAFAVIRAGFAGIATVLTGVFSGAISRALLAVGLLTVGVDSLGAALGTLGTVIATIFSNPIAMALAGLTVVALRFTVAASAVARFGAVLAPVGGLLLRLVGGPIGLIISAIAFVIVKFIEVKDVVFKFGEANASLSEILQAVWRIIVRFFTESLTTLKGLFTDFGRALSDLAGVNEQTWEAFKSGLGKALTTTDKFVNTVIGSFNGLGQAVGVAMAIVVDKISLSLNHAVALAKAAGQDILAAMTFDFSGSNFKVQSAINADENAAHKNQSSGAIADAFKSGVEGDYTGMMGSAIGGFFDNAADHVRKHKDAFISDINEEIAHGRKGEGGGGKSKPTEKRQTGGSQSLPDLLGGDGAGSGKGKHKAQGGSNAPSEMSNFEAGLTAQKVAFEKQNLTLEFSKKQEKKYWDDIIASYTGNSKTLAALKAKSADLDLTILRDAAKAKAELEKKALETSKELAAEAADAAEASGNAQLDSQMDDAQQMLALGTISNQKYLAKQREFEAQRFQIALKALRDRRGLLDGDDTVGMAKSLNTEKRLREGYAKDVKRINHEMEVDQKQSFMAGIAPMKQAFSSTVQGLLQGTLTLRRGMKKAFQSIAVSYAASLAEMALDEAASWAWSLTGFTAKENAKKAIKWLSENAQTAATIAGEALRSFAEEGGAASSIARAILTGGKKIAIKAAEAAAAVYSTVAEIPYVGWILAPIAAAATFAAVLGYAAFSSEGGDWDTQPGLRRFHEHETILPAHIAAPLRDMIAKNSSGGQFMVPQQSLAVARPEPAQLAVTASSLQAAKPAATSRPVPPVSFTVHAMDAQGVKEFFNKNGGLIADSLKKQHRNFKL